MSVVTRQLPKQPRLTPPPLRTVHRNTATDAHLLVVNAPTAVHIYILHDLVMRSEARDKGRWDSLYLPDMPIVCTSVQRPRTPHPLGSCLTCRISSKAMFGSRLASPLSNSAKLTTPSPARDRARCDRNTATSARVPALMSSRHGRGGAEAPTIRRSQPDMPHRFFRTHPTPPPSTHCSPPPRILRPTILVKGLEQLPKPLNLVLGQVLGGTQHCCLQGLPCGLPG